MKTLYVLLKTLGVIFIGLALLAFGSDLLPVEGISFEGQDSGDESNTFYKIVPTEGSSPITLGILFLLLGLCSFYFPAWLKKCLVHSNNRGT